MVIRSDAFQSGGAIPEKFTADGENVSPPLSWDDAPARTKSFALIMDDPDAPAGTWVHWVAWNIPGDRRSLPEGVPPSPAVSAAVIQGKNDFQRLGYGGPAPPRGTHRYFFSLYALDTMLTINPGSTKQNLLAAMRGRILAEAKLFGSYTRE